MARPRKPKELRQGAAVRLRLREDHDALIRAAAEQAGIGISGWMRDRLLRAARQELGLKAGATLPER
jgi:uncharacterized protein (DUF1778 family)